MRTLMDSIGWLLVVPALALVASGCSDANIPFERVVQGGRAQAGIQVITAASELEALWPTLRGTGAVPEIDFDRYVLIGLFLGERSTGGYAIQVEKITREQGKRVRVDVRTREPGPDEFVTLAFTYPGEFVAVERSDLPRAHKWLLHVWDQEKRLLFETHVEGAV